MSSLEAAKLFSASGLVAVITGGGSGLGLMMAKALALNGAHRIYIVGRRKEVLEAAAKESPQGNIIPFVCDVTSKDSLEALANAVKRDVGYINLLVANSGIGGPQSMGLTNDSSLDEFQSSLWNQSSDEYTATFAVNTAAVFFSIVAFLKLLDSGNKKGNVEQKSQVIATSSIGGFNRTAPGGFAYGESKAAVTFLIKQMATRLVPYNIRANVIAPGLYPSDLAAPLIGNGIFPKSQIPLERIGTSEDMAGAILFLTSRAGAYINGNVLITDGGRLAVVPGSY